MRKSNIHKQSMKKNRLSARAAAADAPQPVVLTPDQVIEQLRVVVQQLPDVPALSKAERALFRSRARVPDNVVQASINILGTSGKVADAVGQPADGVRNLVSDANRWDGVISVMKGVLLRLTDANLIRRQRASVIATQVYGVGRNLALDSANADLKPQVDEIKRLKRVARGRSKTPDGSQPPVQ